MSAAKKSASKVVLAYSGGLDTSCIVPWLVENYGCEVICFCANLGQEEELSGLEAKALASGASKLYIEDLREEFITEYIYPTLKAGAIYERDYLLGTSFARPLIAKRMVEIAAMEGADAVSHGATGKGNDQVRFELTVMALNPKLKIIAPWREWHIRSREDALNYAAEHNVPVTATIKSIYSRDRNLWHLSHEGGGLEDPWNEPKEEMFQISQSAETAPDAAEYVEVYFEQGVPKKSNYRRFNIRSVKGPDDFASMEEVLDRRFSRWVSEQEQANVPGRKPDPSFSYLPDLLIVDGGKGQLSRAEAILEKYHLSEKVPVAALAKQNEEIYLPGNPAPVMLPRQSQGLYMVQRIRDEAHRFAITAHRKQRDKRGIASKLDSIPGIGPTRRKALLLHFGSLEKIQAASVDDLEKVRGINRQLAEEIKSNLE